MSELLIPTMKLSYAAAAQMLAAAVAQAQKMQVPQCIAIMDAGGQLLAYGRTDGAAGLAGGPALRKAQVSAERRHPSGALPAEYELGVGLATDGHYTNLAGGLPIVIDGHHVGGIGVSSGSGDEDLEVARAGLSTVGAKTVF